MKIGIDARFYGPEVGGGGLGRYVEQLVTQLQRLDDENRYVLFLKPENFDQCEITSPRFEKRLARPHWYTVREQLEMPRLIDREGLDLIHYPHWNVPLLAKTPFVVTIHDLILLEEPRSARATTRHPIIFRAKHLAYRLALKRALKRARHIITVSKHTKDAILGHFPWVREDRIEAIHLGVTRLGEAGRGSRPIEGDWPYFLYVGNAYPHKNLESLLHAFSIFTRKRPEVRLVLAGRRDVFYRRLMRELDEIGVPRSRVRFVMNPTDAELWGLYGHASLYLFPSRAEGFGLPPLEAIQAGVPVAASRAGSLPEILGDAAVYFSPDDIEEMAAVMERALDDAQLREELVEKGRERLGRYRWEDMAGRTLEAYRRAMRA